MLAFALKKDRAWILAHDDYKLTKKELTVFNHCLTRRLKSKPLAYILGEQEFYGLPFKVNKNVLIPRPETEKLVDEIAIPSSVAHNDIIVDVGTGSGAIIISLAKKIKNKNVKYFAIDVSNQALTVAKQNAKLNGVEKNIVFLKGNLLEPIINNLKIKNSELKITANLPYLTPAQIAKEKSIQAEPRLALEGGSDGLKYYRQLAKQLKTIRQAYPHLPISLYCEANPKQMTALKKIFAGAKTKILKDFRCQNRFLLCQF